MTQDQKREIARLRCEIETEAVHLASIVRVMQTAQGDALWRAIGGASVPAEAIRINAARIAAIVSGAHCGDCGAHAAEPCAPTCGYDGPTVAEAVRE